MMFSILVYVILCHRRKRRCRQVSTSWGLTVNCQYSVDGPESLLVGEALDIEFLGHFYSVGRHPVCGHLFSTLSNELHSSPDVS